MSSVFRRAQIKTALTKFQTFIRGFTNTPINQAKLNLRIENLKEVFAQLIELTENLLEIDHENAKGNHQEIYEEMTDTYLDLLAEAELLKPQTPSRHLDNSSRIDNSSSNQINMDHTLSRMPKLELKKFDGSLEKWKAFSDWFTTTIHNREGISDSTRLAYLQSTLTGEAEKTIAGLEATDENYKEAWQLLKLTYDNKRVIIFRHFELLMNIPKMQNGSADSIRHLINEAQVHIRGMKVLGEPTDQWNTPLLYIITSKLHNSTKQEWNRNMPGTEMPTFEQLITFLREEATRMQSVTKETASHKPNTEKKGDSKPKSVLTTMVFQNCPICGQDGHATFRCEKLNSLTIPQRINAVKTANLCLNCLRANHKTNECLKRNCYKCGKVHHTLLHLNKAGNNAETQNPSA